MNELEDYHVYLEERIKVIYTIYTITYEQIPSTECLRRKGNDLARMSLGD
jgi:hypothetical protein